MTYREPARSATRWIPAILVAGMLVVAAIAASLGYLQASSPPASLSSSGASRIPILRTAPPGEPGEADGVVPDGTTILVDDVPGVANLDPDLRHALQRATADAANDGVEILITSGWRSPQYQEQLLLEATSNYGSRKAAARWVATPKTSPHVSGNAVDLGPADATSWLSRNGAQYGLCPIYRNEPWHYELRPAAIDHGCTPMYADPTHDPRMQDP